jgi:hypothetical protein
MTWWLRDLQPNQNPDPLCNHESTKTASMGSMSVGCKHSPVDCATWTACWNAAKPLGSMKIKDDIGLVCMHPTLVPNAVSHTPLITRIVISSGEIFFKWVLATCTCANQCHATQHRTNNLFLIGLCDWLFYSIAYEFVLRNRFLWWLVLKSVYNWIAILSENVLISLASETRKDARIDRWIIIMPAFDQQWWMIGAAITTPRDEDETDEGLSSGPPVTWPIVHRRFDSVSREQPLMRAHCLPIIACFLFKSPSSWTTLQLV